MPYKNIEERKRYQKQYRKQYYKNNLEKIKEANKQYYKNNTEKINKRNKQWAKDNVEKENERKRKWAKDNPEKQKECQKEWAKNNPEYAKQYHKNNSEKIIERVKQWRKDNPEKDKENHKQYQKDNVEKIREQKRKYRKNNVEKIRKFMNKYNIKRWKTDLKYNLNKKMSFAIRQTLKNDKNGKHWETLVGYTLSDLKKRLKKTMPMGYTWQYFLNGDLHIDHIIPISAFNFTRPKHTDFKRCWALSNLRLLPAKENIIKSSKLDRPFQPALRI